MRRFWSFCCVFVLVVFQGCDKGESGVDYRREMRQFVMEISRAAKEKKTNFVVIPQNGMELVCVSDDAAGELAGGYLAAIDGHGQEDLWFGYDGDNRVTPSGESERLCRYLDRSKGSGNVVLVTDYCQGEKNVGVSQKLNGERGYLSFQAPSRELDVIPAETPYGENSDNIEVLGEARNFLYLINPDGFASKGAYLDALCGTNYDVLIVDLFYGSESLSAGDVTRLKVKANGGRRLVVCYMSIGEAEDYRYYWQRSWRRRRPEWLCKENALWEGNYKVKYWMQGWKDIIMGSEDSYLNRIMRCGADGVYLDVVDAFEYFER